MTSIQGRGPVDNSALVNLMNAGKSENDVDGLPNRSAIQSMSSDGIEKTFKNLEAEIAKGPAIHPLQFLAKVAIAGEEKGYDTKEGRSLIRSSVELYAKNLSIDPSKLNTANEQSEAKKHVLSDLLLRAQGYSEGGKGSMDKLKELYKQTSGAFDAWVFCEQMMAGEGRAMKENLF